MANNNSFFTNGYDDYMFPSTTVGKRAVGIFESVDSGSHGKGGGDMEEFARGQARAQAMSATLDWIANGVFTYDNMDELVVVVADVDGDYDLADDEEELYADIWAEIPDALLSLGCEIEDVQDFVDGPNAKADDAAARLGKFLSGEMDATEADDDDIIAGFAYGEDAILESADGDESRFMILEAAYKKKKVIKDGKVKVVRKRVSGKVRLSAAQKAGLKKARRKANSAAAKVARRKSMKIRKNRGM